MHKLNNMLPGLLIFLGAFIIGNNVVTNAPLYSFVLPLIMVGIGGYMMYKRHRMQKLVSNFNRNKAEAEEKSRRRL